MTDFTETGQRYFGAPDLSHEALAGIFRKHHYADPAGAARFAKSGTMLYRTTDLDMLARFLESHGVCPDTETARTIAEDIRAAVIEAT
jgi:hypothetical protein